MPQSPPKEIGPHPQFEPKPPWVSPLFQTINTSLPDKKSQCDQNTLRSIGSDINNRSAEDSLILFTDGSAGYSGAAVHCSHSTATWRLSTTGPLYKEIFLQYTRQLHFLSQRCLLFQYILTPYLLYKSSPRNRKNIYLVSSILVDINALHSRFLILPSSGSQATPT